MLLPILLGQLLKERKLYLHERSVRVKNQVRNLNDESEL